MSNYFYNLLKIFMINKISNTGFNFDNSSVAFENVNSAINLNNLGFVVGAEVSVVSAIGGNVIVNIKDSRVAINEDMAKRIMV